MQFSTVRGSGRLGLNTSITPLRVESGPSATANGTELRDTNSHETTRTFDLANLHLSVYIDVQRFDIGWNKTSIDQLAHGDRMLKNTHLHTHVIDLLQLLIRWR